MIVNMLIYYHNHYDCRSGKGSGAAGGLPETPLVNNKLNISKIIY